MPQNNDCQDLDLVQDQVPQLGLREQLTPQHSHTAGSRCGAKHLGERKRNIPGNLAGFYQSAKFSKVFHEALDVLHTEQSKITAPGVWSEQYLHLSRQQLVAKTYCVHMTEVKISQKVLFLKLLSF